MIVDWSASSKPASGIDSIWVCAWKAGAPRGPLLANPRTRVHAHELIERILIDEVSIGRRVLVGFDFPYGYPSGFADAVRLGQALPRGGSWRAAWRLLSATIRDDSSNANNRWSVAAELNRRAGAGPGPFWGCPPRYTSPALTATRPFTFPFSYPGSPNGLPEYRLTEQRLRSRGLQVQSAWKLLGVGSVGSQALMGIPVIEALRAHPTLAEVSVVWPFETDASLTRQAGPRVVHAEIWPGVAPIEFDVHEVRDAAQVLTLARHFCSLDSDDLLGDLFHPQLDDAEAQVVTSEEGWVLGA